MVRKLLMLVGAGVVTALALAGGVRAADTRDVVSLISHDYPPFYAQSPMHDFGLTGTGRGFCIDLVEAAYDAVGVKALFRFEPLVRSQRSLASHSYTAFVGSTSGPLDDYPPGMIDSVLLSQYRLYLHYFKSRFGGEAFPYKGRDSLRGYHVASITGSPVRPLLLESGLEVAPVNTALQGLKMLDAGNADFWLAVGITAHLLAARTFPQRIEEFTYVPVALYGGDVAVNFDTEHPDYALRKRQYEEGVRRIRESGLYMRIMQSYFPHRKIPGYLLFGD